MAAEFFRRWDEDALVEARRLLGRFETQEELSVAFQGCRPCPRRTCSIASSITSSSWPHSEARGAFDFELIKLLLGRTLIERWDMWKPAINAAHGVGVYPLFEALASKMRNALGFRLTNRRVAVRSARGASKNATLIDGTTCSAPCRPCCERLNKAPRSCSIPPTGEDGGRRRRDFRKPPRKQAWSGPEPVLFRIVRWLLRGRLSGTQPRSRSPAAAVLPAARGHQHVRPARTRARQLRHGADRRLWLWRRAAAARQRTAGANTLRLAAARRSHGALARCGRRAAPHRSQAAGLPPSVASRQERERTPHGDAWIGAARTVGKAAIRAIGDRPAAWLACCARCSFHQRQASVLP